MQTGGGSNVFPVCVHAKYVCIYERGLQSFFRPSVRLESERGGGRESSPEPVRVAPPGAEAKRLAADRWTRWLDAVGPKSNGECELQEGDRHGRGLDELGGGGRQRRDLRSGCFRAAGWLCMWSAGRLRCWNTASSLVRSLLWRGEGVGHHPQLVIHISSRCPLACTYIRSHKTAPPSGVPAWKIRFVPPVRGPEKPLYSVEIFPP